MKTEIGITIEELIDEFGGCKNCGCPVCKTDSGEQPLCCDCCCPHGEDGPGPMYSG